MATLQNVSGEPVDIPGLDIRVPVDGLFDVDDVDAAGLEANPAFIVAAPATPAPPTKAPAPSAAPTEPTSTTVDASASADTEGAN